MIIEILKFKIAADIRETFIQKDAEIWTTALSQYPGYVAKEVWLNPNDSTEINLIVRWETREQWKAIPLTDLQAIEQKFATAVGAPYKLLEVVEYQILPTVG